jgi:hypothetical protein
MTSVKVQRSSAHAWGWGILLGLCALLMVNQPVQELPGEQNAQTDEDGGEYAESS